MRELTRWKLKSTISVAVSHSAEFSLMHLDVSRAYCHAKAQRVVLVKLPVEDWSAKYSGKIGLLKKNMHGTRDAASNRERDWQGHLENWDTSWFKKSVSQQEKENFGFDTRRRLCGDGIEWESVGAPEAAGECVSNQGEHHRGRFVTEYQSTESENMLRRDRDVV